MTIRVLFLLSIILFAGCASNPMEVSPHQELQKPIENEAQVVFMRSSFVGSAINASLYDVSDGDIKFIGIISNETKVAYKTTPGRHVFMVVSEAADFMEANLNSGKSYFSITTPRMGMWKARFSLWPIKNHPDAKFNTDMSDFDGWLNSTKLVNNTDKSNSWYENNKDSVRKKYEEYWPVWKSKSAEDLAERTLSPQDGM